MVVCVCVFVIYTSCLQEPVGCQWLSKMTKGIMALCSSVPLQMWSPITRDTTHSTQEEVIRSQWAHTHSLLTRSHSHVGLRVYETNTPGGRIIYSAKAVSCYNTDAHICLSIHHKQQTLKPTNTDEWKSHYKMHIKDTEGKSFNTCNTIKSVWDGWELLMPAPCFHLYTNSF